MPLKYFTFMPIINCDFRNNLLFFIVLFMLIK